MTSVGPDTVLAVHARVSIRPEPFGALLYHFSTRQLSFLKDRALLEVVRACDGRRTIAEALAVAEIAPEQSARYLRAIETLVSSRMLVDAASASASTVTAEEAVA